MSIHEVDISTGTFYYSKFKIFLHVFTKKRNIQIQSALVDSAFVVAINPEVIKISKANLSDKDLCQH